MPAGTDKTLRHAGCTRRNRCPGRGVIHHGRSGSRHSAGDARLPARLSVNSRIDGSREEIDDAKRNFRVFARRSSPSPDDGGYDVPHTAITYLLDPEGRLVAHFNDAIELSDLIQRLVSHLEHYQPDEPKQAPFAYR